MTSPIEYDPDVPENPADALATSQPEFLNNFIDLFNRFYKNHVALNAGATAGDHTIIQLLEQGNAYQTDISEISIYSKKVEGQTDQIFFRYQGNGQEFQFTNYQIYALKQPPNQTAFFTFLPGKIIVYFGSFTLLPDNVLNLNPPVANHIMSMSFCPIGTTPALQSYKPQVELQEPSSGFITALNVTSSIGFGVAPPACYYIVIANM